MKYLPLFLIFFACKSVQPSVKVTTVIHRDTIFQKEIHKDTIFNTKETHDTVILKENRLTIKYYQKNDSTAYLSGSVSKDTIIKIDTVKTIQTTVVKEVAKPKSSWENFSDWFTILALIALASFFGLKYLLPLIKPKL
jgi:hypothetical protein